jgi:hypothetical protein
VKLSRFALLAALALAVSTGNAVAQFTPGNVVVERIGNGSAALSSAATPTFLDQYLLAVPNQASPVNTIALQTTIGASGSNLAITDSGTATSNGYLTRSVNGQVLVVPGYNAAVGTASVAGSDPTTISRSIGVVGGDGTVDSRTGFNNGPNNNFRSVATVDGSAFWASTAGTTTTPGILYVPPANVATVANATSIANGNYRNIAIANGSLFASSASGTPGIGISLIGTAGTLPTTTGTTTTLLPGTGNSLSPYGFALINNPNITTNWNNTGFNTLYIADDSTQANGGGLSRWSFDGNTWARVGSPLTFGTGSTAGARGLALSQNGSNVTLVVTTIETSANRLVQVSDDLTSTTPFAGSPITLATAPANTVFRGVTFAPVPEPATVLAVAAGALGLGGFFRRLRRGPSRARALASA